MRGEDYWEKMMTRIPERAFRLQSLLTRDGFVEISLTEATVKAPGPGEVLIQVGGAPVNPTDLAMLLGPGDINRATLEGASSSPVLRMPCVEGAMDRFAARAGKAMTVGIEGAGVVVAAGDGFEHLLGKTVAAMGGAMYAQYALLDATKCLVMPDGVTSTQAASSFVNPLTALAMIETARTEGHTAIVHTAAASNLGRMLSRICAADRIPLVNIVRRRDQSELLVAAGARFVCVSSEPDFREQVTEAIRSTGATLAFDAIGGGDLIGEILHCMELAQQPADGEYDMYGGSRHKQVYVYGALDSRPTQFSRTFGMAWGIGGWLLTPVLAKMGPAISDRLRERVAREITSTFASEYSDELSLEQVLQPAVLQAANRRSTGSKILIRP